MPTTSTHHRACNLCEAICGLAIEHDGERVVSIRGDLDDPFSQGYLCPKAVALDDIHRDPDRLKRPLRRRGQEWDEIGWDEAFDEVGQRLAAIRRRDGKDAVAFYQGNPTAHNYGSMAYGLLFGLALGSRSRFSATSIDQLPRMLVSLLLYGHQALLPIPDVDRTDYFLMLGANPLASNGSIMTAPGIGRRLEELRAGGGKLVVVDPRRSETARVADEHHFIRPGRDALFLAALVHTLFEEKLTWPSPILSHVDGLEEVRAATGRFSPERVASAVGIAAADIRRIAREFSAASSAVCYGRVGTSIQEFGLLATWLVDVVNILTGNLDRVGGSMFTTPAVDLLALADRLGARGSFGKFRSRVRGLPEFGGELPVSVLAEEIETPGPGQIRALVTSAGNPVLSCPNGARLDRAFASLEYMASIDIYLNETTRHAHIILPPTFGLEHEHYDLIFHAVSVRNTARFSTALFPPSPADDRRHDWQIFAELMARLDGDSLLGRLKGDVLKALGTRLLPPERLLDMGLRLGPYGDRYVSNRDGLNLARLRAAEHGVDLGPLQPRFPEALRTDGKRIRMAAPELLADLPRLERCLNQAQNIGSLGGTIADPTLRSAAGQISTGDLSLIGRRQLRSNNSWMHNTQRLVKGPPRCTLMMHPTDATARQLVDGQLVRVTSRVGAVEAPLQITDEVMMGVVSLPHGWGHGRPGVRLGVASAHAGVSVNDLTDDLLIDEACGNSSANGVPVTVTTVAAPAEAQAPN